MASGAPQPLSDAGAQAMDAPGRRTRPTGGSLASLVSKFEVLDTKPTVQQLRHVGSRPVSLQGGGMPPPLSPTESNFSVETHRTGEQRLARQLTGEQRLARQTTGEQRLSRQTTGEQRLSSQLTGRQSMSSTRQSSPVPQWQPPPPKDALSKSSAGLSRHGSVAARRKQFEASKFRIITMAPENGPPGADSPTKFSQYSGQPSPLKQQYDASVVGSQPTSPRSPDDMAAVLKEIQERQIKALEQDWDKVSIQDSKRPQSDAAMLFSRLADEAASRRKQNNLIHRQTGPPGVASPPSVVRPPSIAAPPSVAASESIRAPSVVGSVMDVDERTPLSSMEVSNARSINKIVFNKPRLAKRDADQLEDNSRATQVPTKEPTLVPKPEVTIDYQRDIKPCFETFADSDLADILRLPDLPMQQPQTVSPRPRSPRPHSPSAKSSHRKVSSLRRRFDTPKYATVSSSLPSFWRKRRKLAPSGPDEVPEEPQVARELPQLPQIQKSGTISLLGDDQTPKCKDCNRGHPDCDCDGRRHSETLDRKMKDISSPTKAKIGLFEDLQRQEQEPQTQPLSKPSFGRKLMGAGAPQRVKDALRRFSPSWARNVSGSSTTSGWGSRLDRVSTRDTSIMSKSTAPSGRSWFNHGTVSTIRSGPRISMSTDYDSKTHNIRVSQDAFAPSMHTLA